MAANDEFPRGLRLSSTQNQSGVAASVSYPATPGIAWVLDEMDAILTSAGGANASQFPFLEVLSNGTVIWSNLMNVVLVGGGVIQDERSDSNMELPGGTGEALVIEFTIGPPAGISQSLSTLAHPV